MNLEQAIQQPDLAGLDDQGRLDVLLVVVPGSGDRQLWKWGGVIAHLKACGFTNAQTDMLKTNLDKVEGGVSLDASLASSGVDFGNPEYRTEFAASATGDFAPFINAMLLIGQPLTQWQIMGLDTEPTLDALAAARAANTAVKEHIAHLIYDVLPTLANSSLEQLKSTVTAEVASW